MRAPSACRLGLLLTLALTPSPAVAQIGGVDMVELADGVWAAIRANPVDEPAVGNTLVIVNDEDVVVVDATLTPGAAETVLAEIRRITDKPVRYLVLTHWHDDHVLGLRTYADAFPNLEIVAHPATLDALRERVAPALERNRTAYPEALEDARRNLARGQGSDGTALTDEQRASLERYVRILADFIPQMADIRVIEPTLLVDDELVLRRGEREIRVAWLGRGNTPGDLVVWLPRERIAATGDLVVAPTPFALGSFIGDWIGTLDALSALEVDVFMPGHGPVMRDRSYIETVWELLTTVRDQVGEAVERGLSLEETRAAVDLEAYRELLAGDDPQRNAAFRNYFVQPAVERAWMEARGEIR